MRILACADLHGQPERIARVRELVAEHKPEVVLLPGDLTHAGHGEDALTLLNTLPVPVLAIPGNMDGPSAVAEITSHGSLLGEEPVVIGGVSFGGPLVRARCDVLVTHEPPAGTLDLASSGQHIGTRAVRDLVDRLRPRVLTCGHVHESPGIEKLGDTVVVNCTMGDGKTGGALIELTPDGGDARLL
ncbi:MAG TPA: metallophosphoesterase [bacterium]|nr:metallophosphoesterase [bacterium]